MIKIGKKAKKMENINMWKAKSEIIIKKYAETQKMRLIKTQKIWVLEAKKEKSIEIGIMK